MSKATTNTASAGSPHELSRKYVPSTVCWFTLIYGWGLLFTHIVVCAAAAAGHLPHWVAFLINVYIGCNSFLALHECSHNNICGSNKSAQWINDFSGFCFGWNCNVVFVQWQKTHLTHHALANTEDDPDLGVKGSHTRFFLRCCLIPVMFLLYPVFKQGIGRTRNRGNDKIEFTTRDKLLWTLQDWTTWLFIMYLTARGEVSLAWVVLIGPTFVAWTISAYLHAYLPHFPHDKDGFYTNSRVALWHWSNVFIVGGIHTYHALHHQFPRVPYHKLHSLFQEVHQVVYNKGTRVEGFVPFSEPAADLLPESWRVTPK